MRRGSRRFAHFGHGRLPGIQSAKKTDATYFQTTCFRETTTREKNVWEDASFRSRAPLLTRHRAAA